MYLNASSFARFEAYVKQKGYRNISQFNKEAKLSSSQMNDFKKSGNMSDSIKTKICNYLDISRETLEQVLDVNVDTLQVDNPDPVDEPIKDEPVEKFEPTFAGIQEAIDNGLLEDPRDIEMKAELDKVEQEAVEHLSYLDSVRIKVIADKRAEWEQMIANGVVDACNNDLEQVVIDYKAEGSIEHLKTIVEIAGSLIELKEGKQ